MIVERLLLFFYLLFSVAQLDAVIISKVFFHAGQCEDKIVFYLDNHLEISKYMIDGQVEYLLRDVQFAQEAQEALENILGIDKDYGLKIIKHKNYYKIRIDFNSEIINKIYLSKFTPISKTHGLVIKILRNGEFKSQKCVRKFNHKEVVLDFGHGGQDVGAKNGDIYEKDVVKNVGLKLFKILKKQGYIVHLTRYNDDFLPLDQRTKIANLHTNASLFISLHANHSANAEANGIETYCMQHALFKNLDENNKNYHYVFNDDSANLAKKVHSNLLQSVKSYKTNDRKVKESVSQVLLGVEMPAILIELGFISNLLEAQLLVSQQYQQKLANGIAQGINAYEADAAL